MSGEAPETRDAFLGGRVHLFQPRQGYRAGVDPVLLAAATPALAGQSVLELGCGAGAASLCLSARVADLRLTGVEVQPAYAALARRNVAENGAAMEVVEADIGTLPASLRDVQFDHVIANPPYYRRDRSTQARDAGREVALGGDTPLEVWADVAARRVKPKGYVTFIQAADRLADLIRAMDDRLGSLRIRPIQPRVGRSAQLVIVQARKGGRADLIVDAPLIMHYGERHERDGESYTAQVSAILRQGAPLEWG